MPCYVCDWCWYGLPHMTSWPHMTSHDRVACKSSVMRTLNVKNCVFIAVLQNESPEKPPHASGKLFLRMRCVYIFYGNGNPKRVIFLNVESHKMWRFIFIKKLFNPFCPSLNIYLQPSTAPKRCIILLILLTRPTQVWSKGTKSTEQFFNL